MRQMPLASFHCPSRRPAIGYPATIHRAKNSNSIVGKKMGLTDYASNGGDCWNPPGNNYTGVQGPSPGTLDNPTIYSLGDSNTDIKKWYNNTSLNVDLSGITGVMEMRTQIRVSDIIDGLSNTYLVGERFLPPCRYTTGNDTPDNDSMLAGGGWDIVRWTDFGSPPSMDYNPPNLSTQGWRGTSFGSAHSASFNIALCDGSVHSVNYSIDGETHRRLGNRKDGLPVDAKKF